MGNETVNTGCPVRKIRVVGLLIAFVAACAVAGIFTAGLALPVVGTAALVSAKGMQSFDDLPSDFTASQPSMKSIITAADGTQIAEFFAENRIAVPLKDVARTLQQAVVAIEDRRFLEHRGVDIEGMSRALLSNLAGNNLQGASTLTQQYVKNLLIEQGRAAGDPDMIDAASETTIERKAREAKLALSLEQKMSKSDILEGYLNIAQFGPSVYGVEAASRHYFSKSAKDLSLAEAALLAGIPQSPNGHDPVTNPKSATLRQHAVLAAMVRDGYITAAQRDQAAAFPVAKLLKVSNAQQGCGLAGNAAYFCSWVVGEILSSPEFGATYAERQRLLLRGGLEIKTTLDPKTQQAAFDAITGRIPVGDPSDVKIALSSVQPGTGKILAMAQNTNFGVEPGNNGVTETSYNADYNHGGNAGFPTGSTFKVFTLTQWYQEGHGGLDVVGGRYLVPRHEWNISCAPELAVDYSFSETGELKRGAMTVESGTAYSVNGVFIDMASKMDLCDIANTAAKLGVTKPNGTPLTPNPAFVIGAGNATPLQMANAYATFASHGVFCSPVGITSVTDSTGKSYDVPTANCHQVLTPDVADKVAVTLQGALRRGPGSTAAISRPAAGKTGTTDVNDNTWCAGFVPQLSAAIWVGHSNGNIPVGYQVIGGRYYGSFFGASLAAPAWATFMNGALNGVPVAPLPQVSLGGGRAFAKVTYPDATIKHTPNVSTPTPGAPGVPGGNGRGGLHNGGSGNAGGNGANNPTTPAQPGGGANGGPNGGANGGTNGGVNGGTNGGADGGSGNATSPGGSGDSTNPGGNPAPPAPAPAPGGATQ